MGTWEVTSFGNDMAMDWVYNLDEAKSWKAVEKALKAVVKADEDEYLENDACEEAIAAAEVVASGLGKPGPDVPDEVAAFIERAPEPPASLVTLARGAVERVRAGSEMRELYNETGGETLKQWEASVAGLLARLNA